MKISPTKNTLWISLSHVYRSSKSRNSKAISHMQFSLVENRLYSYHLGKERKKGGTIRSVDTYGSDEV